MRLADYCLSMEAAESLVAACSSLNPETLEMKEHRNCLIGIGQFDGNVVRLHRLPSLTHAGYHSTQEDQQDWCDILEDSDQPPVPAGLRPFWVGLVERCGSRVQPLICTMSILDPLAAITLGASHDQPPVLVYSSEAVVANLAKDMTEDEASEYFSFNVVGSYNGPGTPLFA